MKRTALAALVLFASALPGLCAGYDDLNSGISYFNLQQHDTAIGLFDKALAAGDLTPDQKRIAYHDRGLSYVAKGDIEKALADFTAAIAAKPDNLQGYRERASIYRITEKNDLALDEYLHLNALRPQDYATMMNVGWLRWLTNRPESGYSTFLYFSNVDITSWLWLQLVNIRRGDPMTRFVEDFSARNWPGHIPRFFQGSLTEAEMLEAAKSASAKDAACDANFYAGMWRIVHKDADGAAPLFDATIKACEESNIQHLIARAELSKIKTAAKTP